MATSVPQLALITGASKGIGQSTALAFAKAGVSCVLVGRSLERLQSTLEAVRACGVEAFAFGIDLGQVDELPHRFTQLLNQVGPINILVNNAGMAYTNDLLDTPPQDWQAVIDLNLTSPFLCTQAVLPQMRSRKQGTIINVISVAGRQTFPQWGAYCASKFGLMGFSKTLAQEERSY
ncbi:MAG TPA: SDR family NAD(P)-dependent oxidoreductase, partial [Stenomitos sp.]